METLNTDDRKQKKAIFCLVFFITLLLTALCGSASIVTAQKGISLLKEKKAEYDEMFKKQAELNFQMEELFKDLNNLKMKQRNTSEHKHMQQLITRKRLRMEDEISLIEWGNYEIYQQMLEQIKVIQSTMDNLDRENKKRDSNMEQLEKCRMKYQELTKQQSTKP